jgi:hypothetical protein
MKVQVTVGDCSGDPFVVDVEVDVGAVPGGAEGDEAPAQWRRRPRLRRPIWPGRPHSQLCGPPRPDEQAQSLRPSAVHGGVRVAGEAERRRLRCTRAVGENAGRLCWPGALHRSGRAAQRTTR